MPTSDHNQAVALEALNVAESASGLAEAAVDLAQSVSADVAELRKEWARRWVVDNLDNETIWCKPSVMSAAIKVESRYREDALEDLMHLAARGEPMTDAELDAIDAEADEARRAFIGMVVTDAAVAAVSKDGFTVLDTNWLVVKLTDVRFVDGEKFPRYKWQANYERRA
jgi:hypothetical protein